ncbi:MAG: F0F1 ATP synthase subunit epsilon [Candidatus Omnitrophica bacterium]|nr:F0F1 ATP synthase subunit epsilon [Candidatus Omnitrophota bacterium]
MSAEKSFHIEVLSPSKVIFEGDIASLVVPAKLGYLGVLADHAPLAAALSKGNIIIRDSSGKVTKLISSGSGFLEVLNNHVSVLLDSSSN